MPVERDDQAPAQDRQAPSGKKPYSAPKLIRYGEVHSLTRAGIASKNEGNPGKKRIGGSDPRLKENVVRIGTHSCGAGLYLFDYRPEFREAHGHGRQFGVMADEVERLVPGAVSRDTQGFLAVDYALLGIERNG
jgi:hypothetical protein